MLKEGISEEPTLESPLQTVLEHGDNPSPTQNWACLSYLEATSLVPSNGTLLVTSLSFILTLLKSPLTPLSLSLLLSIYMVMPHPSNVTSFSPICPASREIKPPGEEVKVRTH